MHLPCFPPLSGLVPGPHHGSKSEPSYPSSKPCNLMMGFTVFWTIPRISQDILPCQHTLLGGMALRYLYLYDHGQLQVMLKPSKCGISRTPITVTTKMMIPCLSIYRTHSFTKKPRHRGSHSHSFRIGNRQGSSDPCSLTGQQQAAWKCERTSHVAGARRVSTHVTGATMPGQVIENIGEWIPSGKLTYSYGKSPLLMGKSTINGHFQ